MSKINNSETVLRYKQKVGLRTMLAVAVLSVAGLTFAVGYSFFRIGDVLFVLLWMFSLFSSVYFIVLVTTPRNILIATEDGITFTFLPKKNQTQIPWHCVTEIAEVHEKRPGQFLRSPHLAFCFAETYDFGWRVNISNFLFKTFVQTERPYDLYIYETLLPVSASEVVKKLNQLSHNHDVPLH